MPLLTGLLDSRILLLLAGLGLLRLLTGLLESRFLLLAGLAECLSLVELRTGEREGDLHANIPHIVLVSIC